MEFQEAKDKFITHWGTLATQWGINRTMAQIHALLLISPEALSTDQIMEELQISRGNANLSLRQLMQWGIVFKELKTGDRKDYFYAEKDIWKMANTIAKERKKREIDPVLDVLQELKSEEFYENEEQKEFQKAMSNLHEFVDTTSNAFNTMVQNKNWINTFFIKMLS